MLKDNDLKLLIQYHTSIIYHNDKYFQIHNSILDANNSSINNNEKKTNNKSKCSLNLISESKLKTKLAFKLASIILCLKRLTDACGCNYIDEKTKYDLIRNSLIKTTNSEFNQNEISQHDGDDDNQDEVFKDYDETLLEEHLGETDRLKHVILTNFGKNVNNSVSVDYTEDIIKSTEKEIEQHLEGLRCDFPHIDDCISDHLWPLIVSEWLYDYKDSILNLKYNVKNYNENYKEGQNGESTNKNQIEIYEDDNPFFIV